MEITDQELTHLAALSNLSLGEEEKKALKNDLKNILKYISKLDELDVSGVEPTFQVFEMENVWRNDEIVPQDASREALLALASESLESQIKVPKVL